MIGLLVAVILMFCKVELTTVVLVFIGFQLFTLAEIERIRFMRDVKARRMLGKAMESMAKGIQEGMHGKRNAEGCKRDQGRDGE